MAKGVLIVGESGSGKSTSVEKLDPSKTFIINVKNKPLPFRGGSKKYSTEKKNYFSTDQSGVIISTLKNISEKATHIKTVIIDDAQYVAADEFMVKSAEKGFQKFNDMAKHVYDMIDITKDLREDLVVFYMWHPETITDAEGVTKVKAKTIGKMLDQYITVDGLFTYVLFTDIERTKEGVKYWFVTNTDGKTTAKTPKDMFPYKIENDLSLVISKMEQYENSELETVK